MAQVDRFRGAPGFYWGIWALIQATISQIDFDYAGYAEIRLGEDLADQTHPPHDPQVRAIGRRQAGGFLTAVLQRVEREEHQASGFRWVSVRLFLRDPDPAYAAHD